jgi:hypothetical protein
VPRHPRRDGAEAVLDALVQFEDEYGALDEEDDDEV